MNPESKQVEYATKQDLLELRFEILQAIADLRIEMHKMHADILKWNAITMAGMTGLFISIVAALKLFG